MRLNDHISNEMQKPRIALITACGAKKNPQPMEAYKLYRSSRIKAVYNRRGSSDMYVLSAEYGLVGAHEKIEPYERVIDEKRAQEMVPTVTQKLKIYDYVIFFKGGARKAYFYCIRESCKRLGKTLVTLGYAFMGGINDLPKIISMLMRGDWEKIRKIDHVDIFNF